MKLTADAPNNSEADQLAINGFQEVYEPVKEFLRDLDHFLLHRGQVGGKFGKIG